MKKDNILKENCTPDISSVSDVTQWFINKMPEPTLEDVEAYGDSNALIGEGLFNKYWGILAEELGAEKMSVYSDDIRQQIKSAVLKNYNVTLDKLRDNANKLDLTFPEYVAIVNYVKTLRTSEGVMSKWEHEKLLGNMSQAKHSLLVSALKKLIKEQ